MYPYENVVASNVSLRRLKIQDSQPENEHPFV